ncbi:MAG: hypothetical protein ACFE7R_03795, partial [Candidatus Hodarchaeota archaeon]
TNPRLNSLTFDKWMSALTLANPLDPSELNPFRVREIHDFSFYGEEYTINEYDELMENIPNGLTDEQLQVYLSEYVNRSVEYAKQVYEMETTEIPLPPEPIITFTTTTATSTYTTTTSSGATTTSSSSTPTNPIAQGGESTLSFFVGVFGAAIIITIAISVKRRTE